MKKIIFVILLSSSLCLVSPVYTNTPVSIKHDICLMNCNRNQTVCKKVFDKEECDPEYKYCINSCECYKGE